MLPNAHFVTVLFISVGRAVNRRVNYIISFVFVLHTVRLATENTPAQLKTVS